MPKKVNFLEKVVVITGGSSGLGLELAKMLVPMGAKVALLARNQEKLEAAKKELLGLNAKENVSIYSVDIVNEDQLKQVMNSVAAEYGGIDILVNSAGILEEGYFEHQSLEVFKNVMETNYLGTVNATKAALDYLKASRGSVVNIASMASFLGVFAYTSYCASKFAVLGFSEALRYELKPQGINVTVVCPPEFEGPMVDGIDEGRTFENKQLVRGAGALTAGFVAKETLQGMEKRKPVIIVGAQSKVVGVFARTFPGLFRKVMHLMVARVYRGPA